ncbi:MAG: transcriptional repressor [Cyanobacteria bacterium J083]|nr:MAG: transcriptional repressor [Cyanobacteria bacterium J083]
MKKVDDPIITTLKAKGLRVTPQRYAIYANLASRQDHPTVEQLLQDLNETLPISSQATVYSSLQTLREVGLVREILLEEGRCRYDANIAKHHHFRCRCCGKIRDIAWENFADLNLDNLDLPVKAESYEVIVQGICDTCGKNS